MYSNPINEVHVELTDRCNAECPVCPRSLNGGPVMPYIKNQELGLDYFLMLGEDFCKGIRRWNFCGTKGDPSAAKDPLLILEFLLKCNPNTQIEIRTNGGAKTPDYWAKISNLLKGTHSFVVWSVDGLEHTNHIYRKNVKWSKVWANMIAYFEGGGPARWEFLKFAHNKDDIPVIAAICKKYNVYFDVKEPYGFFDLQDGKTRTIPVYNREGELEYSIKPHYDAELFDNHDKTVRVENHEFKQFDGIDWASMDVEFNCQVSGYGPNHDKYEVYIDSDGAVYPCCYIASKYMMREPQLSRIIDPIKDDLKVTKDRSITQVLQHNFYIKTLTDAFEGNLKLGDNRKHCSTCVHHCGKILDK
jgi:MoaA/NifB/PqqE/SkfB family radical SAM enzyme